MDKNAKILIVGLGLIGGSYAKVLKQQEYTLWAIDINQQVIDYALRENIIDRGSCCDETLIREADAVIFGLYPNAMVHWVREWGHLLKPGIFLTDVAGVKAGIVDRIQEMVREDLEFIPSHPMAGREAGGIQNSDAKLFQSANFIITPTEKNTPAGIAFAKELAHTIGCAHVAMLTPEEHDRMVGYLSQLTHVIAVCLMNANTDRRLSEFTGDSFRDLTRIARINETLWSELCLLNGEILTKTIDRFIEEITGFRDKLAGMDRSGLEALLIESTKRRREFDVTK